MGKPLLVPVFVDLEDPAITRAMVEHILEHVHIIGHDRRNRAIMRFEFPVPDWMIDGLAAFGAGQTDLEDGDEDQDEVPVTERVAT